MDPDNLLRSEGFRTGVRETMDQIRQEERDAQRARREEQMARRTEERAREIAERLQLNPQTADALTEIIVAGSEARGDVFALVRSGEIPRDEVRQVMREQREMTNTEIQSLLTPTEYEQYLQIEQEMNPFGGGGRGRGGFGGGAPTPTGNAGGATPAPVTEGNSGGGRF